MLADLLKFNKPTESAVGHLLNISSIAMTTLAIVMFCLDSLPALHRDITFLLPVIKIQVGATVIPFWIPCSATCAYKETYPLGEKMYPRGPKRRR